MIFQKPVVLVTPEKPQVCKLNQDLPLVSKPEVVDPDKPSDKKEINESEKTIEEDKGIIDSKVVS